MHDLEPDSAARLVAKAVADRGEAESNDINLFGFAEPEGMPVRYVGGYRFVSMHELAYFAIHGRVKEKS